MKRTRSRSHLWPRTRDGRIASLCFVAAVLLAQPPIVLLMNRIEPRPFGVPFLYAWLLATYVLMIGTLIWAWRRGL